MLSQMQVELQRTIHDLMQLEDVAGVAIVRNDGLIIAHQLPDGTDPKKIAAMSAAIVGTGQLAAEALEQGQFLRSVIVADMGKVLATEAGNEAILMALVLRESNVGFILMALEKAGERLRSALAGGGGSMTHPGRGRDGLRTS